MRLDHLCDLDLGYRSELFGGAVVLVAPYGTTESSAYGEGDGSAVGDRLRGEVRWTNHPRRRSDGAFLPDSHGMIRTDDGADIIFSLSGRTTFADNASLGVQNLHALFEAESERYRWLNDVVCVAEGKIDPNTMRAVIRVYVCVHEL
ncbi:MAG: DUF3237 family protein [Gaiellales bacterium]